MRELGHVFALGFKLPSDVPILFEEDGVNDNEDELNEDVDDNEIHVELADHDREWPIRGVVAVDRFEGAPVDLGLYFRVSWASKILFKAFEKILTIKSIFLKNYGLTHRVIFQKKFLIRRLGTIPPTILRYFNTSK